MIFSFSGDSLVSLVIVVLFLVWGSGRMRVLSEATQVSLSAGQVITSPTDVVRELVENALDAGATSVQVKIGTDYSHIVVHDNGCGIPKESRPLLGIRYCTSKITDFDDLATVHTLGFRGEVRCCVWGGREGEKERERERKRERGRES